jgi:hypothetical protein
MGVVEETADIVQERKSTDCIVTEASLVIGERVSSNSRIRSPVVLSNNAVAPTAVLESPLLTASAAAPTAVLQPAVVF